jgi:hypothetical protein
MKRSITPWTTAVAAAALFALPAAGWAQTATTGQTGTPVTEQQTQEREQHARADDAAKEHLREARTALDRIDNEDLSGDAQRKVAELKRHFSALERSVGANDRASATGAAQRSEQATEPRGNSNWQTEVAAVDRLLAELIGPAQGTTGAVGTSGTTGATGTTGAAAATVTLDEPTREALADVRKHVTKFAAKMNGEDADRRDDSAATAAAAASTTAATSTATGTAAAATQTTATQTTTDTTTAQAAQGQAGAEQARRHLTEARNTLSELTQLPQAAQLSGEARTHVSQLIANFNELITTQENWRASYAKVEANLDALLGPEAGAATATVTGTTGTGTTGTVGTSGAATVADLDPEVRTKLEELRAKLNEFERAAGGGTTAAQPMNPAVEDATVGAAATGAATAGTTTPQTTAQQSTPTHDPSTHGTPTGHMDQAEVMRHIEAIEAIINANDPMASTAATAAATGTTGTTQQTAGATQPPTGAASGMAGEAITLSRAQVDQLRVHLNQLRALVQR